VGDLAAAEFSRMTAREQHERLPFDSARGPDKLMNIAQDLSL
jgi:hypothetical protein